MSQNTTWQPQIDQACAILLNLDASLLPVVPETLLDAGPLAALAFSEHISIPDFIDAANSVYGANPGSDLSVIRRGRYGVGMLASTLKRAVATSSEEIDRLTGWVSRFSQSLVESGLTDSERDETPAFSHASALGHGSVTGQFKRHGSTKPAIQLFSPKSSSPSEDAREPASRRRGHVVAPPIIPAPPGSDEGSEFGDLTGRGRRESSVLVENDEDFEMVEDEDDLMVLPTPSQQKAEANAEGSSYEEESDGCEEEEEGSSRRAKKTDRAVRETGASVKVFQILYREVATKGEWFTCDREEAFARAMVIFKQERLEKKYCVSWSKKMGNLIAQRIAESRSHVGKIIFKRVDEKIERMWEQGHRRGTKSQSGLATLLLKNRGPLWFNGIDFDKTVEVSNQFMLGNLLHSCAVDILNVVIRRGNYKFPAELDFNDLTHHEIGFNLLAFAWAAVHSLLCLLISPQKLTTYKQIHHGLEVAEHKCLQKRPPCHPFAVTYQTSFAVFKALLPKCDKRKVLQKLWRAVEESNRPAFKSQKEVSGRKRKFVETAEAEDEAMGWFEGLINS
ncbi:aldehyde dehydrogenase [Pseudohyphozyma bogoriensis]|nr:aldehyde dehydrogenase [Pseudohyphozyma bogoriensis]